jgi:DNA-binding NtrC family response regulator
MESMKILIVDDDPSMRTLLEIIFKSEETVSEVQAAPSSRHALKLLEGYVPDVLITDSVLPGASGEELAGIVRQDHPEVRIISFSGLDRDTGWADGVVSKGSSAAIEELRAQVLEDTSEA